MVVTAQFYNLVAHYQELARNNDDLQVRLLAQKLQYWKHDIETVQRENVEDFMHKLEHMESTPVLVEAIKSFKRFLALTGVE